MKVKVGLDTRLQDLRALVYELPWWEGIPNPVPRTKVGQVWFLLVEAQMAIVEYRNIR